MKLTVKDIEYIEQKAVKIVNESILNEKKGKGSKKCKDSDKSSERDDITVGALKNKGLNLAQYAYRLYPKMDKASARSKFYKKIKHEKVHDGYSKHKNYRYSLSGEEASKVDSLTNKILTNKL